MYDVAIALSVLLSFALYEGFGLLTGGMVSAGYLCLYLEQPLRIVSTLLLALLVYLLTRLISRFVIVYGRRRFMLTLVLGLVFGWLVEKFLLGLAVIPQDIRIIGHVVPGLIANDMYKQGIFRTLLAVMLSGALLRVLLMVVSAL
ncbi:poly-gamma-glutamate biosynthesis protein PgsC [Beduinella massiliensis]|uniref:poly-gamma-glutamate biosynthesis protein PgsC n=1 Tax=Beduinella massiliensis TaxID=1852363 RepID=UPI000C848C48